MDLSAAEVRVLGCLVEKERTTPQAYPLTLNALVNACKQTTNRDPVVSYDEATVQSSLDRLRERGLSRIVHSRSNRAAKFRHVLDEGLGLHPDESAVLAVLMLRGPQTSGELRARTERMSVEGDIAEVLDRLTQRADSLVVRLERQPGQKEARWAHLLAGEPVPVATPTDRVAHLEAENAALRAEVAALRRQLEGSDEVPG